MQRLLEAAAALRDDLDGHVAICREIIDDLHREVDLATVMDRADSRTWRPRLTDMLTVYDRVRHQARLRLEYALGVCRGHVGRRCAGPVGHHQAAGQPGDPPEAEQLD